MSARRIVIFHEAGHAVVALRLGWVVDEIVIENFQDGFTSARPRTEGEPPWREQCLICLAGLAAERRVTARPSMTANDERAEAIEMARREVGPEAELLVDDLEREVDQILEESWPAVDALSRYLVETMADSLSSDQILRLVDGHI